jgi:hypothetical protein
VPIDPVAETPVRGTLAIPVAFRVPTDPVAETPVTLTSADTVPRLANGAAAKEVKPNMYKFPPSG